MNRGLKQKIEEIITPSESELELILSKFHPMEAKKNEILIREDQQHSQKMFFIASGCLRIYFINSDGIESTRHFSFENQFATVLSHFITNKTSSEYIQSLEKSTLWYITKADFYSLLDKLPIWERFYRKYLEYAYVANTTRLQSFITLDAKERYRLLLEQNPIIVRRLSNKVVASYLSISQETLSRLKSKL